MRGNEALSLNCIFGFSLKEEISLALKDNIEKVIKADIEVLGYEIEYIEVAKEGKENYVRVVIDKPGASLNTEDCEKVSRTIEDKIDAVVSFDDGYILEVSSAGLERQLKNISLFKKYIGENVLVRLYKKYLDKKEFTGKLVDVVDDNVVLECDTEKVSIKFADIAAANTVYDFNFEKGE